MLRIKEWNKHYENAASRKLHRLDWVPVPVRMDGPGYVGLVDHEHGAEHFAAWMAIVEIAATQEWQHRGELPRALGKNRNDLAGICRSLARISRLSARIFEEAIPRLIDEIQWIEVVEEEGDEEMGAEPPALAPAPAPPDPEPVISPTPPKIQPTMRWKRDETFSKFAAKYRETGAALIDEDFSPAFEFCWKTLDWEQRLARMKAVDTHMAEFQADPRFVPKPLKFLEEEWKRPVRPRAGKVKEDRWAKA